MHRIYFLCMVMLLINFTSNAQKKIYTTTSIVGEPPQIDGNIDDTSWSQVEWAGDFVQHEPHANQPATQKTEFKILYNDHFIFVAVRCFDSAPDSIVRRMARRDVDVGDWVKIVIDSYHDLMTAFSFGVSAAGVKIDEAITNGGNWDTSWDPIWDVKTAIDDKGWTVEASIPISQLRFGKQESYVWGLEVGRRLYRKEELSIWQFFSPTAPSMVYLFGELHGIKNLSPKKQKDITPYAAIGGETYEEDPDNPFADGKDLIYNAGVDGKVGLTNNLTLDFSLNPDFGQVEADPSEVNLTTFETKFDEKRPFFIEGKNILSFNVLSGGGPLAADNIFYSRRIGRSPSYWPDLEGDQYMDRPRNTTILGALKLTGKTKEGWSVGILESVTQRETARVARTNLADPNTITVEPLTNYFISRVQRDLNQSNTQIGAMVSATNRDLDDPVLRGLMHSQAYTAGIDLFHQWKNKTYYINVTSAFSRVIGSEDAIYETQTNAPHYFQRPGQTHMVIDTAKNHLDGFGGTIQFGKAGNGKWMYTFWVTARSPGFNMNDVGYVNRNDEIQQIFWVGFRQREPFSIFRNMNFNFNQWWATSFGLERRYLGGNINGNWTFKNYWSMGFGIDRDFNSLSTETLRGGPAVVYDGGTNLNTYLQTDERKRVQFTYSYYLYRRDSRTALAQNHALNIRLQLSDAWSISLNPRYSHNFEMMEYVETLDGLPDPRYIRGTLRQTTTQLILRTDYSITPELTLQLYCMPFISAGDYTDFKYISDADADNFYDRFTLYESDQLHYNSADEIYEVDENFDLSTDYTFNQPNFNVFDFNLNLVIRWEYRPGSTLFLVWSQHRSESENNGSFRMWDNTETLFMDTYPRDVLMVKLSHRFAL